MSIYSPVRLFRASALDAIGDDWAADGVHIRVNVSPQLGAPLHPFLVWRIRNSAANDLQTLDVRWADERGQLLPNAPFDVSQTGPVTGIITGTGGQIQMPNWSFISVQGDDGLKVELLDRAIMPFGQPVIATRSRREYAFGGMQISCLRVSGAGVISGVLGLNETDLVTDDLDTMLRLGLPLQGSPWYATKPDDLMGQAKERLFRGQGKRLGPADQPDGAVVPLAPEDDVRHILEHLAPQYIDDWLNAAFTTDESPGSSSRTFTGHQAKQDVAAKFPAWSMLLTMSADPRIARYLGLYTVDERPSIDVGSPAAWLIAGEFAISNRELNLLQGQGFDPQLQLQRWPYPFIRDHFAHDFPDSPDVEQRLNDYNANRPHDEQVSIITMATVAVAVMETPPDLPNAPVIRVAGPGSWNGNDPGNHWTQSVALLGQPPNGTISFARSASGTFTSLHKFVPEVGADARASALLANANANPPNVRTKLDPEVITGLNGALWQPPIVTDSSVSNDPAGGTWRLWVSDEFGRWSDPADLSAGLPERPKPPAPAPELDFTPIVAPTDQLASPGSLTVRIDFPAPESLAPGARPITGVQIDFDGSAPQEFVIPAGQTPLQVSFPVKSFLPGDTTIVEIAARFVDSDNRHSFDGTARRKVFDPRPVVPPPTAPTILWTGRPDATNNVELALRWRTPVPNARYRVYLGTERQLAKNLSLEAPANNALRAATAKKIYEAALPNELRDKSSFTLLTETPLKPDGEGIVVFRHLLPSTLRGVQFVRVVPVTDAGVEAAFERCGLVPVALPSTERPNVPSVSVSPDPSGVKVQIAAYINPSTLKAFDYPHSGRMPEFRVRRVRGLVGDAIYLPIIKEGTLTPPDAAPETEALWTAEFIDDAAGIPPYVQHSWLAEVRYPPEPSRLEGINEQDPLLIRPAWGVIESEIESLWSGLSLPAGLTRVDDLPPAAPEAPTAVKNPDGSITITVPTLPPMHPKIIRAFQIEIWKWVGADGGSALADNADGWPRVLPLTPGDASFQFRDATEAEGYSLAWIDPLGRLGTVTRIQVTDGNG